MLFGNRPSKVTSTSFCSKRTSTKNLASPQNLSPMDGHYKHIVHTLDIRKYSIQLFVTHLNNQILCLSRKTIILLLYCNYYMIPYLDSRKVKSDHVSFRHQQQIDGGPVNNIFDNSLQSIFRIFHKKCINVFNGIIYFCGILDQKKIFLYFVFC